MGDDEDPVWSMLWAFHASVEYGVSLWPNGVFKFSMKSNEPDPDRHRRRENEI